ncbi:hypothetical protein J7J13_01235 [bacterium]|nr:hypothetical protein [bacterium]
MKSNVFIISGPSGAGEDSVIKGLKKYLDIERVITTTTREMRPGESQGRPYYFIPKEEFKKGVKNGDFFEWAEEDNNNFYGVTHKEIKRARNSEKIVIWKVDYKGVLNLKKMMPEIPAILINAPLDIIEKRIRNRGRVSEKFIQKRIKYAQGWTKNKNAFDYSVENEEGKLDETVLKVAKIIKNDLK